jgi:ABC-2 type transport system permease protein
MSMRTLYFLLQKEFLQTFRDPAILRIIFIMPVIQLIILPLAADYEVKDVKLAVVDQDHSPYSRRLIEKMSASTYFTLTEYAQNYDEAIDAIEKDKADLILQIPTGFEKNLIKEDKAGIYLAINAVNGAKGGLGGAYASSIIKAFNGDIRAEWVQFPRMNPLPMIETTVTHWYNPSMNYPIFMVPGILVILVTLVGSFLSALNIVREKEVATIEQLNVTPIKKWQFILGKLIPFWVLGLAVTLIGLLVARLIYGIVPAGNILTIMVFAAIYLIAILGFGLLISTYSDTQQQAMIFAFFFMMLFILLGGLYTSIDAMPTWAIWVSRFNPASYFIEVMRMIILKGSTLWDIREHLLKIALFGVVLNGWAIWSYRKTV